MRPALEHLAFRHRSSDLHAPTAQPGMAFTGRTAAG